MSVLTITPTYGTTLDLDDPNSGIQILKEGIALPVPAFEETYAAGADSEGGPLTNSAPQNVSATAQVILGKNGQTDVQFYDILRRWQTAIDACRRNGGVLVFTPPNGTAVTYDIVSARLTDWPMDGGYMRQHHMLSTAEFTCLPFGRLASQVQLLNIGSGNVTQVTSNAPLMDIQVNGVPGVTEALPILTLTDNATQAREYFDYGVAPIYAGESAALIDSDNLFLGTGAVQTTRTGAYDPNATGNNVIRGAALSSAGGYIGYASGTWYGPKRIKARIYQPNLSEIYLRAALQGPMASTVYNPWQTVQTPGAAGFVEVDFGVMWFNEPPSGGKGQNVVIYQYSPTRTNQLDLDYIEIYPAWIYGQVRQTNAIPSGGSAAIRYNSPPEVTPANWVLTGFTGGYLRLPPGDSHIVCKARRNDVAGAELDDQIADSLRATMTLTPRVSLL